MVIKLPPNPESLLLFYLPLVFKWGGRSMLIRPVRQDQTQTKLGSPYCSDPNCESCKQLREAQEKLTQEHVEFARKAGVR
jgi:hypothetical protein